MAKPRSWRRAIVRLVANNPSPFTFKGTNTYIVGQGREIVLIDPGPADATHLAAILRTIGDRTLTHIVITHTHHDHVDGLPALLERTGAKTAGFGRAVAQPGKTRASPPAASTSRATSSPTSRCAMATGWRERGSPSRRCIRRGTRRIICASRSKERSCSFRAIT